MIHSTNMNGLCTHQFIDLSMDMPFKLSVKWHEERLGDYDDSTLSANFGWKF